MLVNQPAAQYILSGPATTGARALTDKSQDVPVSQHRNICTHELFWLVFVFLLLFFRVPGLRGDIPQPISSVHRLWDSAVSSPL